MVLMDLKKGTTLSIRTSSDLKWTWSKNNWKARSDLGFRKFNKIVRCGLKILEFVWR
jgi:hypothetical protein